MPRTRKNASHHISTLNEKPLHAALKKRYSRAYDRHEILVDGFLIDIVRDDLLIEIQTGNFSAIRRKLEKLTEDHRVRLVYPIAREKWIIKESKGGKKQLGRRKSPKRGIVEHVCDELVHIPRLMANPNFSLEVLLIKEEEVRRHGGRVGWRGKRGWVTHERRLLDVVSRHVFEAPSDVLALIPADLEEPFTTADVAKALEAPVRLAQQMAYCLRHMGAIELVGKRGNAHLYNRALAQTDPGRSVNE